MSEIKVGFLGRVKLNVLSEIKVDFLGKVKVSFLSKGKGWSLG